MRLDSTKITNRSFFGLVIPEIVSILLQKMFSAKNNKFLDEIKRWNTSQLIEALESNGLSDFCEAIQSKEIDGESFLNLTEGQLAFWRNSLSTVQIRRLWSYIQLAKEKPQDFVSNIPQSNSRISRNIKKIEKLKSPIAISLERVLGQQNVPFSSQINLQEQNPSKPALLPPKPGLLPPKSTASGTLRKRLPPLPGEGSFQPVSSPKIPPVPQETQSNTYRPTVSIPPTSFLHFGNPPGHQHEEEEIHYEEEPKIESTLPPSTLAKRFPPLPGEKSFQPVSSPKIPPLPRENQSNTYRSPVSIPPTSFLHFGNPPGRQHGKEEPKMESNKPLIPNYENSLPEYQVPPSNPKPVRREVAHSNIIGRPLPSPPKDEHPFRLTPNLVPLRTKPENPSKLPVFRPPPNIPSFHEDDDTEDEEEEYDIIDQVQTADYKSQPWFRDIDRRQATNLLKGRPNGAFIVRSSTKPENECTVSVVYEQKIYNLSVEKSNGKLILGKNTFNKVSEIVEKFLEVPMVLAGPNKEDVYVTLRRF